MEVWDGERVWFAVPDWATYSHDPLPSNAGSLSDRAPIGDYDYPTGETGTLEDKEEDKKLRHIRGPEKPWLSQMVIEDRGPR